MSRGDMDLRAILLRRIAAEGPMPLSDYMAACLLHPVHGYYTSRDPLGRDGDFITAPEISQMFGELIGLCLAQSWLDQGAPSPVTLAELGPGRGTLIADVLRATAHVPGFHAAVELHLVEASPVLRARQQAALAGHPAHWHDQVSELPEQPLLLIANEFFDALPIRQFRRSGDLWRETVVGATAGALSLGLSPPAPIGALQHRLSDTAEGDIVEICPGAAAIAQAISTRIETHGGAALIVDYGDWHALGDTFQALRGHAPTDPLADPGTADLTAHVDFETLADAASAHSLLTPQGVFLERLGITERAQRLADRLSGDALSGHIAAHRRLTHPQEMGTLFKVIAFYPSQASPPPGLEAMRLQTRGPQA
ncbi:SAM-dependent methyltransferase [Pseudooceanicola sp.]|uniref:class I SAM-dependent methyltransferase n=1 Tax=Pseudooceanicola sp. TaxID=1914328 RepID=UPI00262472D2|nr:SAM-dependent methyltransferase [Pseudooceanicola sp.]MDF1854432.1 SAM-dependent methyltransferase [Pseudooceanicola sp.]